MKSTETYLKYASTRDVVFILGAGASHPDGVPLQDDILAMILSDEIEEIYHSDIAKQVNAFIKDNFYINPDQRKYPKLEAVFGFIDYFIERHESLSSHYNHERIREIKENLIKLIHYIVNLRTDKQSHTYHMFWKAIQRFNRNISIITLNYDTLLEQAFDFMFKKHGYIDYCIHLMNYDQLAVLKEFNFWINPREPVQVSLNENPAAIKLIKVHGSLNWKYCNCCNQTLLTPWDRKIDLNRGKLIGHTYPDQKEYDYYCPIDATEFQTLIMPPSYIKSLDNPFISQLIGEASRELRLAKKCVFIGYSLSDADIHIKAFFRKQLKKDTELVVVNIKSAESLIPQYYALSNRVRFIQRSFEDMLKDDTLMQELLR